jgi:hypothetical protein
MNGYGKINEVGYLCTSQRQEDSTWKLLSEFELKEDGTPYAEYNQDGTPDLVKEQEEAKLTTLSKANAEYEEQVKALTVGIPESEKLTWTKQEQEARAYLLDNTVATPLLDGIVVNRGVDKDYLVTKVIEKADMYAMAVGTLTGLRQKAEDGLTS